MVGDRGDGHPADRVDRECRARGERAEIWAFPGAAARSPRRVGDDGREDRERDLGRRAGADVDPGRHVDQLEVRLGDAVGAEVGEHAGATLVARHQADVRHAHLEAAPQRVELVPPVGGDDDGEVFGRRLGCASFDRDDLQPELSRRA